MKKIAVILILWPFLTDTVKAGVPKDLIVKAISALGNWDQVQYFEYNSKRLNQDRWQGYEYKYLKQENDEFHLFYDLINARFLHHTINHYPGGYIFNTFRLGLDSAYLVYDGDGSRTGKELLKLDKEVFVSRNKILLKTFPYFILKEVLKNPDKLTLDTVGNQIVVHNRLASGDQELWFNATDYRLNKTRINTGKNTVVQYFKNYITIQGCLIAKTTVQILNGEVVFTDQLSDFKMNSAIKPVTFSIPSDLKIKKEYNGPMTLRVAAKDVYIIEKIDGDRNIVFINMDDYIVMSEAPVSIAVTQQILSLIHQTIPDKPIRYVHLSHFHNDHIAGIAALASQDVSIICTPEMEGPIIDMLSSSSTDKSSKITPSLNIFSHEKVLSDAHHRIEFIEIKNTHAKGLSFLYLPDQQIIFEGDLLSAPEDGTITPAIAVSRQFYDFLQKKKIPYKRIIGHHGSSDIKPEWFEQLIKARKVL